MSTFQNIKEVEASAKTRMEKVLADFQHDVTTIRTGRASVNMLEPVQVEAYGSMMPLSHVATLHVADAAMITVQPFDNSQIGPIEKAIRNAGLGLNPGNDGKLIRVPIPALNEERRKELVKKLHGMAEDHRVALRNVRRDSNDASKKLLKDKLISEDDDRRAHEEIQKLTDAHMAKIDALSKSKEKDILEVK
ncbi:MAG: ribosome recycling factor [Bryobacterales bacterium]|nr:ribosome recycling factor [Bryobacterales bacterium]